MAESSAPKHLALVVEDDPRAVEMIAEIVFAAGCDYKACDNSAQALSLFRDHRFCLVLLDFSIKSSTVAIKADTAHGRSVLREIRHLSQHHTGLCWWLPIIVISAHLNGRDDAIDVMRDGAAAIVDKPFEERVLTATILSELERCGRGEHQIGCQSRPMPPAFVAEHIPIRLPGARVGRRTVIYVGEGRVELTDACLITLLRLLAAKGSDVHKNELGARSDTGFHAISRLSDRLEGVLDGLHLIENNRYGTYGLAPSVRVVECDVNAHAAIGNQKITELTTKIARSLRRSGER